MKRITIEELAKNAVDIFFDVFENDQTYDVCDSEGKVFATIAPSVHDEEIQPRKDRSLRYHSEGWYNNPSNWYRGTPEEIFERGATERAKRSREKATPHSEPQSSVRPGWFERQLKLAVASRLRAESMRRNLTLEEGIIRLFVRTDYRHSFAEIVELLPRFAPRSKHSHDRYLIEAAVNNLREGGFLSIGSDGKFEMTPIHDWRSEDEQVG